MTPHSSRHPQKWTQQGSKTSTWYWNCKTPGREHSSMCALWHQSNWDFLWCFKKNNLEKRGRRPKWIFFFFTQKNIQMANRHMERCSTSLLTGEMHVKTTVRYHLTSDRVAILQSTIDSRWRCGGKGILVHCWWEPPLVQLLWKIIQRSSNKILSYDPLLNIFLRKTKTWKRYMHPCVHVPLIDKSKDRDHLNAHE